jgi:hypothetical protein
MSTNQHHPALKIEIERIVRQVLSEMAFASQPGPVGKVTELAIADRVVSLELLAKRLDGVTRLTVPRGAVITPSARDELRRRSIVIASAVNAKTANP